MTYSRSADLFAYGKDGKGSEIREFVTVLWLFFTRGY